MVASEESQGPDRCRGNLNCREFHDELGALPEGLGRLYNCCCCDPCRFIRPFTKPSTEPGVDVPAYEFCCRCVPRGILLRFIPDDPDDECCVEYAVPMLQERLPDLPISVYRGKAFATDVTAELGRDEYDNCVWRISAETDGTPVFSQTYAIDHDTVTCLSVPAEMAIPVTGPTGCDGTLILDDFPKARLPFVFRESENPYGLEYLGDFVDLADAPCGDCEQVCTRLCVVGKWHPNGAWERVEFVWFDDGSERGWQHRESAGARIDRILLVEDDYGNCTLATDFEDGPECFDPIVIDSERGCSCGLYEVFVGPEMSFLIRCGQCSCWNFFCGNCRCVPRQLCVLLMPDLVNLTPATRVVLDWDPDNRRWGSDADPLRLYLGPDEPDQRGSCVVTPDVSRLDPPFDGHANFNCPEQSITRNYNPSVDFLSLTFQDAHRPVFVVASALTPDCALGNCQEATPCAANCGTHPASLNVHFDISSVVYPGDCPSFDVQVFFWQTVHCEAGTLIYYCGYVGFYTFPDPLCCTIKVEVRGGYVRIEPVNGMPAGCLCEQDMSREFQLEEECDPYWADTGWMSGTPMTLAGCLDCTYDDKLRITVTELPP
jgi:hypothetical protein